MFHSIITQATTALEKASTPEKPILFQGKSKSEEVPLHLSLSFAKFLILYNHLLSTGFRKYAHVFTTEAQRTQRNSNLSFVPMTHRGK
jgi:hypothetical protein